MAMHHQLQALVQQHMQRMVDDGIEEGMQFCVYRNGNCIIDVTVGQKTTLESHLMQTTWSSSGL